MQTSSLKYDKKAFFSSFSGDPIRSYIFGFNGKEKLNEQYGEGNCYDYGFRIYDPRISRFLSVDPLFKSYPWYTPYQFAGNKPIWAVDLDGLEEYYVTEKSNEDGTGTFIVTVHINPKTGELISGPDKEHKVQYTKIVHGAPPVVSLETDFTGTHAAKEKEAAKYIVGKNVHKGVSFATIDYAWKTDEKLVPNTVKKSTTSYWHNTNDLPDDIDINVGLAKDLVHAAVDEIPVGGTLTSISFVAKKDNAVTQAIKSALKNEFGVKVNSTIKDDLTTDFSYKAKYTKEEGTKTSKTIEYEPIK